MGEWKARILLSLIVILLMVTSTVVPALIKTDETPDNSTVQVTTDVGLLGGSLAAWEDDFYDASMIDMGLSYNYIVDTDNGTVFMNNTCPAWVDTSFTRVKPIDISNSDGTTFYNYILEVIVDYDMDMQTDFDDLRFADEQGGSLSYWISEKIEGVSANVLVLVPEIPAGATITIFMFYGNPSAMDESDFDMIFTWEDRTDPDIMVSFKAPLEGAWDSDVEFGGGRFLVAWEERAGPEDWPFGMERALSSVIHGRTYNVDGGDPFPDPNDNLDIDISDPGSSSYHAENPSIAFGAGKFFVVWEENPANVDDRYEADIMGAFVYPDGTVERFIDPICGASGGQFDPHVAYDSDTNRFFVAWEDAHLGFDNYNVLGAIYTASGSQLEIVSVASDENYCEYEPWVCSDDQGHFMVVYESGYDPIIGPFSLYAKRFDDWGNEIGSTITIAEGDDDTDYIFPAVSYNTQTERYFVAWNDGDISQDPDDRSSYDGNIWGKILDNNGDIITDNFIVQPGTRYIRTDVVPYFNTMFFVSYDGTADSHRDIWGRLLSSDGAILTDELTISDGSSLNVDWNNLAVGEGRIFATWEDERDVVSEFADAFGNVWGISQSIGSPDISHSFGYERELVIEAVVTSKVISPDELVEWDEFDTIYSTPIGNIQFDILNEGGTEVIMGDIGPNEDISSVTETVFRLRATFTRTTPVDTPVLDKWNVSWYMWDDIEPPWTEIMFDPAVPDGNNGWYVSPVNIVLTSFDNDTSPENITTFYNINSNGVEIYDSEYLPVLSSDGADNQVEFWSEDNAENEEIPHNVVGGIKIDKSAPSVNIMEPIDLINPGEVKINGTVTEYTSGSGVDRIIIKINDEVVFDSTVEGYFVWFEWNLTAEFGETYDIQVMASDKAGNQGQDRRQIIVSDKGAYEPGYIYVFENPKIGPLSILENLDLAVISDYDALYVVLPSFDNNASSVKFAAEKLFLKDEFTCWDVDLSDGCSCELEIPIGFYEIKTYVYDEEDTELANSVLISRILVILL